MFARERSGPPSGSVIASPSETATAAALATGELRGATGERIMLDPKETKKGGFGAFAQRDRERREAEELKNASPNGVTPPAPTPPTPSGKASSDASGTT